MPEIHPLQELLTFQYGQAMDLYVHEDQLNWQKVYTLFYVTTGLFAAFGLALTREIRSSGYAFVVCVLGLLVSLGFGVANWNGVTYLQDRKDSVIKIERRLRKFGGVPIVTPKTKALKRSPTTYVIRGAPIAIGVTWICVLILLGFKPEVFDLESKAEAARQPESGGAGESSQNADSR